MTTHYQKIQALGERMASNLETMGVSASFSDGGLTLADKILQIQHFTDGLLLFADKKIEQAGTTQSPNTITLSALLIEDGKAKSGEKITTDSYTVYTVDGDGEFSFTGMKIIVNQGMDYSTGIGSASTFKITISNSTFSFAINGNPGTIYGFTYDSTKPLEIWVPIEATNISNKFGYSDTTDSRGIATYEYTCTGAGLQSITAKTTLNGIFLQETYEVLDCLYYGDETLDLSTSSNNPTLELSTEWSSTGGKSFKLTPNGNTATYYAVKQFSAFSEDTTLKLKFDCKTNVRVLGILYINSPWTTKTVECTPTTAGTSKIFLDAETDALTIPSGVTWGIRFDIQAMYVRDDGVSYMDNIRLYRV